MRSNENTLTIDQLVCLWVLSDLSSSMAWSVRMLMAVVLQPEPNTHTALACYVHSTTESTIVEELWGGGDWCFKGSKKLELGSGSFSRCWLASDTWYGKWLIGIKLWACVLSSFTTHFTYVYPQITWNSGYGDHLITWKWIEICFKCYYFGWLAVTNSILKSCCIFICSVICPFIIHSAIPY